MQLWRHVLLGMLLCSWNAVVWIQEIIFIFHTSPPLLFALPSRASTEATCGINQAQEFTPKKDSKNFSSVIFFTCQAHRLALFFH